MIQISGIKVKCPAGEASPAETAAKKLGIKAGDISRAVVLKQSVDAREKPDVYKVYTIGVESAKGDGWLSAAAKKRHLSVSEYAEDRFEIRPLEHVPQGPRPVVAGFGPCGMFAALALAKLGLKPIVLERGGCMQERIAAVEAFWAGGRLDPECNVQFGEGGAGTFSDGKLTTGTRSPYAGWILRTFAAAGAQESILYLAKPHIGTDLLRTVVVNIRKEIEALGGEIRFGSRLESLGIQDGKLCFVNYSAAAKDGGRQSFTLPCGALILAIGHSARDTMKNLLSQNIFMEQKPFSIGLRIEHPQQLIDLAQYGASHEELGLGPADYKLSVRTSTGRGAYTFCMCPGGSVVSSSSEEGSIVTNGMSSSARDSGTANSALLADVLPEDFRAEYLPEGVSPSDPMAGAALQEKYEKLAFKLGGGKGLAPAQTVGSFLGTEAHSLEASGVHPSFLPGVHEADLSLCLPGFAADALKEALPLLGRKLKGFDSPDAVLTGIESRSSSPVRIKRDPEDLQGLAVGPKKTVIRGFFPAGEGAGYAGGIMSAAADGVRAALKLAGLI